jgi:polyisoprenoid-binding protein YceI
MKTFLFALTLLCAASHCIADDLEKIIRNLEGELGTAKFEAVGNPGFLTIEGDKGSVTGKYSKAAGKLSGSFDIDLNSFSTDMELRDEHMKTKYLETKKYPKATLTVENVVLPKDGYFKFSGKLQLHGKTNPASGDCLLKEAVNFECKFKVALTDYGIAIPEWKGVTVAKDVNIVVRVTLK